MVGSVAVGGDAPISVQSMTNTLTTDVKATLKQIEQLQDSGVDIVSPKPISHPSLLLINLSKSSDNIPPSKNKYIPKF